MSDFLDSAAAAQKAAAEAPEEERPEIWNPKEAGTQLKGVVVDVVWPYIKSAMEHRWLLVIEDLDSKKWSVWCSSAVLKRLIIDVMPAIGAEIVITYDGNDQKTASGYNYKSFQMAASQFDTALYHQIMKDTKAKQAVRDEAYTSQAGQGGGITPDGDDAMMAPFSSTHVA